MLMTNKFKGLALIDKVPKELWMKVRDIVQEAVIKTIPKRKKCKQAKWLSAEVDSHNKNMCIKTSVFQYLCIL